MAYKANYTYVNLPVKDLDRTKNFFSSIGFFVAWIIALSADSREHVDELADKALAAGGKESKEPADHGFMYVRSFEDLDGHLWEIAYMDMGAFSQA